MTSVETAEPTGVATLAADSRRGRPEALLRPHLPRFLVLLTLQVFGAVAGLAPLLAVVELGRTLLAPGPPRADHARFVVALGAVGLLLRLLFTAASSGIGHLLDNQVQLDLRRRLAAGLGRVPIGWLAGRRSGELAKVVGDDVRAVHPVIAHTPGELVSAFVVPAVSLVYLFGIDWRLTLITLVPVVLAIAMVPLMMTPARQRAASQFDSAMGQIANSVVEFVRGISVVKIFGGGRAAHGRFDLAVDNFAESFLAMVRGMAPIAAAMQLVLSPPFVMLVVLAGGSWLVTAGELPPADLMAFLLLGLGLTAPVAALGHGFDDVQAASRALGRIREVLAEPSLPEPVDPVAPRGQRIEFQNVHFGYRSAGSPGTMREVLRGIDLVLEPGTLTAVVGPSGSGKSTLVQLLPRFFDPTSGAVLLGGVDLRKLSAKTLHDRVSFVFQDTVLLRATVTDNIALAVPGATDEQVKRAAERAGIDQRILELPDGYDTVLGGDQDGESAVPNASRGQGQALSGGEAQRISLARALLADTEVLVLDEATAFADPQTERVVRAAITDARARGRTVLVIAHRLDTIRGADTVVVLEDGQIVERGRPDGLLTLDGRFARLWRSHAGITRDDRAAAEGPPR